MSINALINALGQRFTGDVLLDAVSLGITQDATGHAVLSSLATAAAFDSTWNGNHLVLGTWHYWVDTNGKTRFKNGAPASALDGSPVDTFDPQYAGTYNGTHLVMGTYHYWVDVSGNTRYKNGVPTSASDGQLLDTTGVSYNGAWNGTHLVMGNYHYWVDAGGSTRVKFGAPTSDTDGAFLSPPAPLPIYSSAWNGAPLLKLGATWFWMDSSGRLRFKNSSAPTSDTDGAKVDEALSSAWNGNHLVMGAYHYWVDATGKNRYKNGAPTFDTDGTLVDSPSGGLPTYDGLWNGTHLILGAYHYWVDPFGRTRIKSGAPTSSTDGAWLDKEIATYDAFWNGTHLVLGPTHIWVDAGNHTRTKVGTPASDTDGALLVPPAASSSLWNGSHLMLGAYHLWIDDTETLRMKSSGPVSQYDGAVVNNPPDEIPPTQTVTQVTATLPHGLRANWSAPTVNYPMEIEWHRSTDSFASNDTIYTTDAVTGGATTAFVALSKLSSSAQGRCRMRYVLPRGNGVWSAYSNTIELPFT